MGRLSTLCMGILFCVSCREQELPCVDPTNPDCPNYDHCLVFEAANADFIVYDSIYGIDCHDGRSRLDLVSEADTTFIGEKYFRALHPNDSYQWLVGTDPQIHTENKFVLNFTITDLPQDIDVTLVVCKAPPVGCNFIRCDTMTKAIHFIPIDLADSTWSYVIGTFKGIDTSAPNDSFTIRIPPILPTLQGIINFPNGCVGQYLDASVFRKQLLIRTESFICQSVCGIGSIQDDLKTLIIDYSVKEGNNRILKKFVGRRI